MLRALPSDPAKPDALFASSVKEKAEEEPEPLDIISDKLSHVEEHIAKAEQTTEVALALGSGS